MKEKLVLAFGIAASLLFTACGSGSQTDPDYLPFQSEEDGNWGMISTDGEVLFADEFDREPTMVYNDRFMVRNSDGLWEIYTAEEKPKQVGAAYKEAGVFYENVAPVVEPGKCIELINKDGEVVKTLDKLAGRTVAKIRNFSNGLAVFTTDEDKEGVIDTDGDVVVEPIYYTISIGDEAIFAVEEKYRTAEFEKTEMVLLSLSGKEMSRIKLSKFTQITKSMKEGLIAASTGEGSDTKWGLIDKEGEWVLKPTSGVKGISEIQGKNFIYYDGNNYGLMNTDGEIIIRAKYDMMRFVSADRLAVAQLKSKGAECRLIDLEGEKLGTDTYGNIYPFYHEGSYAVAQIDLHSYTFIDKEGKEKKNMDTNLYDIGTRDGDYIIESDYVDYEDIVSKLNISKSGLAGMKLTDDVTSIVHYIAGKTAMSEEPESYKYNSTISYDMSLGNVSADISVYFDENFVSPIKETEEKSSFWGGYTYTVEKTVGYEFKSINPKRIEAYFKNIGKLSGKLTDLYQSLTTHISKMGKVAKKNEDACLVECGDSIYVMTRITDYQIDLSLGYGDATTVYFPE